MEKVSRILYRDGNIYYRVKDLTHWKGVGMNLTGVPKTKLDGWGNTLFIKEQDVPKITINKKWKYVLKTKFVDSITELDTECRLACLCNAFAHSYNVKKTSEEQCISEALKTVDNFNPNIIDKNEERYKYIQIWDEFNRLCEEYGYSNRIYYCDVLVGGELETWGYMFDADGNIILRGDWVVYGYENNSEWLERDIKEGVIYEDYDIKFELTKGEAFEIPSKDYIVSKVYEALITYPTSKSMVDYIDITLPNGEYIDVNIDALLAMVQNQIKVVKIKETI